MNGNNNLAISRDNLIKSYLHPSKHTYIAVFETYSLCIFCTKISTMAKSNFAKTLYNCIYICYNNARK